MTSDSTFQLVRASNVWSGDDGWELLFYYNLYRFGVALVLIALASPNLDYYTVGKENPTLVFAIAGFTLVSVLAFFSIKRQAPAIHIQAHFLFLLDIVFISILTWSHELHDSNIVIFYITTVAATAVMFRTKTALGYAAISTIIIYTRDILDFLSGRAILNDFYFTALIALGLFTIVLVVSRVARRTRVVQDVLEQQELDLADLDDINKIIVDQLKIGIIFLEDDLSIKLINKTARELVGEYINGTRLGGKLAELITIYLKSSDNKNHSFRNKDKVLNMSFIPMRSGVLVRIEDQTTLSRKIQKTKLSSVGRFASAISHEIRNPLNAINHAAQLIKFDASPAENQEMIDMIRKHVKRIDKIIESVLERNRPGRVQQKEIDLQYWLKEFCRTFRQTVGDEEIFIAYSGTPEKVFFDPTQLEQILTNLCQNSIKYGKAPAKLLEISLITGRDEQSIPYLDIMNNGAAIPEQKAEKLFEPFYTTQSQSTGLGLYLSKEYCVLNGADIEYFSDVGKHGFRISFMLQEVA